MEKKNKIPQVYGYSICVIAIITFLITTAGLINSIIDAKFPEYNSWSQNDFVTFEKYKMNTLNAFTKDPNYIPTDEELQLMFEKEKAHNLQKVKIRITKDFLSNGIIFLISIILFWIHWRWMRKS